LPIKDKYRGIRVLKAKKILAKAVKHERGFTRTCEAF
jgi:hypothetical protein